MSRLTKFKPQTLEYVQKIGCAEGCSTSLKIDNGLELPCKEWTNYESSVLRVRMLTDNQLMQSGLIRMVDRSSLGNSLRIRKMGIDVGPIRTEASGASSLNSCDIHYDTITMEDFEKTFYVTNTEKNLKICLKDLIGTKWQDLVSDTYSDYQASMFANTDLADLIIAGIIEKYARFVPKRIIMSTFNNPGEDLHGDDGILAKAYYASKGQYFHTWSFDLSSVNTNFNTEYIQAIVGGLEFNEAPTDHANASEYILSFVDWLNGLQDNKDYMFDASVDLSTYTVIVASNFPTYRIDLRIVLNDGTFVDWGCAQSAMLAPTELQRPMMINDVPLLFQYEAITNANFWQKFKEYFKEFKRNLHRNGYEDINMSDIRVAIDPELLLERDDQFYNKLIECCETAEDVSRQFLPRFIPLNCMNNTGLFFMTIDQNILLFSDSTNIMGGITNFGRIRTKESNCDNKDGEVLVQGGAAPIGMDVEQWGAFATNIAGSYFVKNNKLDTTEPYANTKKNLACYDDNVRNACLVESACSISTYVTTEATYDAGDDETTITVTVNSSATDEASLVYDLSYSLSDGTSDTGITSASFVITLPGDQTNSGVVLSVSGTVTGQIEGEDACQSNVYYTQRLGEGNGVILCEYSLTNDNGANSLTDTLTVSYTVFGTLVSTDLVDDTLSLSVAADYPAIEQELEAIFPDSDLSVTGPSDGSTPTIVISDLPSYYTNVIIESGGSGLDSDPFTQDC